MEVHLEVLEKDFTASIKIDALEGDMVEEEVIFTIIKVKIIIKYAKNFIIINAINDYYVIV